MNAHSNPLINPFLSTAPTLFGKVEGLRKGQNGLGIEAVLTDGTVLGQELLKEFLTIKKVLPRKELDLMAGDLVVMHVSGTKAGGDLVVHAFTPVTGQFKQLVELCRSTKDITMDEIKRRTASNPMYLDILAFVRLGNVDRLVGLAKADASQGKNLKSIWHMGRLLEAVIEDPKVSLTLAGKLREARLIDDAGNDVPLVMRVQGSNAKGNGKSNGSRKGDQRSPKAVAAPIRMVASVTAGTPADPASSPLAVLNEVHVEESAPTEAPANAPQEEVVVTA
jgi:hypothetical protein